MYKLILFFGLLFPLCISAQDDVYVTIQSITIEGNEKTRDYIILRELDFAVGDSVYVPNLGELLERSQNNLLNTSLFNLAEANVSQWDSKKGVIDIIIKVKESWFIYIVPIGELADRNFNVWWNEFNGSLKRVNLGVRMQHLNMTGNNDRIKFLAQFGFTPKFELEYVFPYINKAKTLGASFNIFRSVNKETGYINENNRLKFFKQDEMRMLRRNRARLSLNYRPNLYASHTFDVEFQDNQINSLIGADLNPNYFLEGRTDQLFLSFNYKFSYDERDVKIYPLSGIYGEVEVKKSGLGLFNDVDLLTVSPVLANHFRVFPWLSIGNSLSAKISLIRNRPPYFINRGLGYGNNYVRGYELYVVDGQDYLLTKNSAKIKVFEKQFDLGNIMFIDQFRQLPIRLYFSLNFDAGIVNDQFYAANNDFTNRLLYGGGPGIDLIMYNNFVFQFELSTNHLGEVGFFIHNSVSF